MRAFAWLNAWARAWPWAFALCLAASVAPFFVSSVLPFHDQSGAVGLVGALVHLDDSAARIRQLYTVDIRPYPSAAFFAWAWLWSKVGVSVPTALSAYMAVFGVAGPPLAMLLVLRAFDRPRALALLAFPIAFHHQIWFGFIASAGSVTAMLVALACARFAIVTPSVAAHLGLAAALTFVAASHPFSLALALSLLAPLLVWPPASVSRPRAAALIAARLACLLPACGFLASWASGFFGQQRGSSSLLEKIDSEFRFNTPSLDDFALFFRWLGDGYQSHIDDVITAVALIALLAFLVVGVRDEHAAARPWRERLPSWGPLAYALCALALGFLLLPMKLMWPNYWWGVRVRCVAPLFFLAAAAVRRSPRGLPHFVLLAPAGAAVLWAGYITVDFAAHFRGRVLDGFSAAIADIPPGQRVAALLPPERHYTQAHPYLVQHYVARSGGVAAPGMLGHPGSYWVTPIDPPLHPPWGDPQQFVWAEHSAGVDYFLIEAQPDGAFFDPLENAPAGSVERVAEHGHFRLYRTLSPR